MDTQITSKEVAIQFASAIELLLKWFEQRDLTRSQVTVDKSKPEESCIYTQRVKPLGSSILANLMYTISLGVALSHQFNLAELVVFGYLTYMNIQSRS